MKKALWIAASMLVAGATVEARPAAGAEPGGAVTPLSAPADLAYLHGSWRVEARDPNTGEILTVDYRLEPVAGGAWLAGAVDAPAAGIRSRDVWGRDPETAGVVRIIFDGSGALGIVRSSGWRGDTLVLEGATSTTKGSVPVRETITRLGPSVFRAVWESKRNGVWTPYSIETAKRL